MKRIFSKDFWHMPSFMLNIHLRILSIVIGLLMLATVILSFMVNIFFGLVTVIVIFLALALVFENLQLLTQETNGYLNELSYRIKVGGQENLLNMPIGTLLYNDNYEIEWVNPRMQEFFGNNKVIGKKMSTVSQSLVKIVNDNIDEKDAFTAKWDNRYVEMMIQPEQKAIYMVDVTYYKEIQKQFDDLHLVIGQIFLDNYDELTESMSDQEVSNLHNFITNTLSNWGREFGLYIKQVDEDHYFMLGYVGALEQIEAKNFSILDIIREATSKQNSPITLSIGVAYGDNSMEKLDNQSKENLDLALGRGGDQVVVREVNGQARFYGGKTNPMAKRTRVRARMISNALNDLMSQADQVFVMGHARPDMDSIGAGLGIRRIAKMNNHRCWIVVDEENIHSDIQRLLKETEQYPEIKGAIISPQEALEKATEKSLLVMVDHSKASISISPDLFDKLQNRVMVIDHHRRGEEFPDNPILVYIEPYASSTCELITEMFEYQNSDGEPVNKLEATAMLTGIIIDTKSFSHSTGTRTFDAASYLRMVGADLSLSQHFMKENVDSYMKRNHLIDRAEFIRNMAIAVGSDETVYDSVTAAQAADSLLSVSGVQASFSITRRSVDTVGISARSDGTVNVQVIMEQMGGGGHLGNAATQVKSKTVTEVREELLAILDNQIQNSNEKA